MKHLIWLLFLQGFLCYPDPLTIRPDSLVTWKGSCVLIPCKIGAYKGFHLRNISLRWYFQPFYDVNQSDYSGTLLYGSSETSRSYSTQSKPRVAFKGNLEKNKDCSLKISDVQKEDAGIYGARILASYGQQRGQAKWFLNATVNVTESPPVPKMDIRPKPIQESWVTVTCSAPYPCPDDPLRLIVGDLEQKRLSSQIMTTDNGVIQTVVGFQVTWEDHGRTLVCSLQKDWSEISRSTMQLDVKYAPKDVRLTASPDVIIDEGKTLYLECTTNSSNPEVSEYLWYKDDQLHNEWQNQKKIEFVTQGDQHSGVYRCVAKNIIGKGMSNELRITVYYPPKEVKVDRKPQGDIKEGASVVLQCSSKGNPEITQYEWYKHPETVVLRPSAQLQFDAIQLGNAGTYYCIARNRLGFSKSSFITLDVFYVAKDVQLKASPGTTIQEGERLSLECTTNSSNPEVSEYLWYKDDQLHYEWQNQKKIEFVTQGDRNSGVYRCAAKNIIGTGMSNELRITVYSGPQSSPTPPSTSLPSTPLLSTSGPPSQSELPPSRVPIPPVPSSQKPCDGRTLWEELCSLSELEAPAGKAQNQIPHSCKELNSAVVQLAERLQKDLLQIRQRTCIVPSKIMKQ